MPSVPPDSIDPDTGTVPYLWREGRAWSSPLDRLGFGRVSYQRGWGLFVDLVLQSANSRAKPCSGFSMKWALLIRRGSSPCSSMWKV